MKDAMKDFAENEGGIYRMASKWDTSNSYVGRVGSLNDDGTYSPSNSVNLYELNEGSEMWSSLKWRLERVEDSINVYRIKNMWANSYLTRTGEQDKYGEWYPAYGVVLADLHSSWWSQQWVIEHTGEATFKIRCLWGNSNDYMTRLGAPDGVGGYLPTNEIRLQRDENYSSQHWLLYRTL
jgi:endo-1,4-beta-xylanase